MQKNYHDKLQRVREAVKNADTVLIGGGAGLSTADGLYYSGERFRSLFPDFIKKYQLTDMYSSGFYNFPSQEEKWAYWSRHIMVNRFDPVPGEVYQNLLKMAEGKEYFVLTTNADGMFARTGFDRKRIFEVQGDYAKLQCATPCHHGLYDNHQMVEKMVAEQGDCAIPSELIPVCPNCSGPMEPNLRKDGTFVEDSSWHDAKERYVEFLSGLGEKKLVLFELGVGYNTPTIIKYPFEQLTAERDDATLVRMNLDHPEISTVNKDKTVVFKEDIKEVLAGISS